MTYHNTIVTSTSRKKVGNCRLQLNMSEREHDWEVVVLVTIALCIILELSILFKLSFQFWCQDPDWPGHSVSRFEFKKGWTVVFIVLCIVTAAVDFVHIYMAAFGEDDDSLYSNRFRFVLFAADFFYFVYTLLLYALLMNRVFSIFKDKISNPIKVLLATLCVANATFMIWYLVIAIQLVPEQKYAYDSTVNPNLWIPIIVVDVVIQLIITLVMIYKLRKLVIDTASANDRSLNNLQIQEGNGNNVPLLVDEHGQMYIEIMSQFSVLSAIILIVNQMFPILVLSTQWATSLKIVQSVGYASRDIGGFIDCVVVFLTFKMNETTYNAFCFCHGCMYSCFLTNINQRINIQE